MGPRLGHEVGCHDGGHQTELSDCPEVSVGAVRGLDKTVRTSDSSDPTVPERGQVADGTGDGIGFVLPDRR